MVTIEHLRALGADIDRLRIDRGFPSIRKLAAQAGLADQHVGQIIRAYVDPKRGFSIPTDEFLEKLAMVLDVPVSRFHARLGRFPDNPIPAFNHPEVIELAEAYDKLPDYGQKIVRDTVKSVQEAVGVVAAKMADMDKP